MKNLPSSPPPVLRRGTFPRPNIRSGEDLFRLRYLDRSQWVVLGCPVEGLHFPKETIDALNGNGDDRILCEDLLRTIDWLQTRLKSANSIDGNASVCTGDLDLTNPDGLKLAETIQRILINLGRDKEGSLSLQDLTNETALFSDARTNGDGVLPPNAANSEDAQAAISAILKIYGATTDRTGEEGLGRATFTEFTGVAPKYLTWLLEASEQEDILPFQDKTNAAYKAFSETKPLLDSWFDQCRLQQITSKQDLIKVPLQTFGDKEAFDFTKPIHPEHETSLARFFDAVLATHFDCKHDTPLDRKTWSSIKTKFEPHEEWHSRNPDTRLDNLDADTIEALLNPDVLKEIEDLFAQDSIIANELERMEELRKLLLFKRDLLSFAREFAAMPGIYDPSEPAIFQTGTLFLAGRKFHLCIHVEDPTKHAKLASESGLFLIYCEILGGDEKRHVVAAVTDGTAQGLAAGRHGLFYDRSGREWKATIIRIVPQAISLKEGFLAPFQRLGELIATQFEKISSAREKKIHASLEKGFTEAEKQPVTTTQTGTAHSTTVPGIGGILAGGGVAFAALSSSLAFITTSLSKVDKVNFLYTATGFLTVIILPSIIIVARKLRRRDLSILLDASGWAINPRIKITRSLSRRLTEKRKN